MLRAGNCNMVIIIQVSYFTDVDVVQGVNALAGLLNVLSDRIWKQFVDYVLKVGGDHVLGDELHHLLTYRSHL